MTAAKDRARAVVSSLQRRTAPGARKQTAVAVLGAVLAATFLIGGLARVELTTGVDSFLPSSDAAVDRLHDHASAFGADAAVVLLESDRPHSLLGAEQLPTLLRLEGRLASLPDVSAVYGPATILNQVAGRAQDLLAELSGRREGVRSIAQAAATREGASPEAAATAADQASADFDRRYGSLLAQGLPAGLPTIRNQSFVTTALYDAQGQPRPQWRFVVPSDRSVSLLVRPRQGLDQEGTERLVERVRVAVADAGLPTTATTVSGVPAVVAGLGHQIRQEIPLIGGVAVVAVALCFLLVPWTRKRRRLLPVATTLLATAATLAGFGWVGHPLSLAVVAFLPVLLGIGSYYPTYWAQQAKRRVVVTVALATAASFGALTLSPLPFVRDLGMALGAGILSACAVAAVVVRVPAGPAEPAGTHDGDPAAAPVAPAPRSLRAVVAGMLVLVAAGGWIALPAIPLQSDFTSFTAGLDVGDDVARLEQALGSTGEVDLVLRGPDVTTPEAMAWMVQAQEAVVVGHGDVLRPVTSPPQMLGFLGNDPAPEQIAAGLRLLPPYLVGAVIGPDHDIAALAFGSTQQDAGELRALRDEVLASLPAPPEGYSVDLTGLPMLAARGYELVDADRLLANTAGVVAAGVVLALGLSRRRADAGRAVVAAALATGTGLGLVWLTGTPLNPVTVALGSLTAAVGCEFTVMLAEARRTGRSGLRRSVVLAALTSAVGYLVLALSGLAAIREFGLLLSGSVLLALGAAHLVVWVWPPGPADRKPGSAAARPDDADSHPPVRSDQLMGAER